MRELIIMATIATLTGAAVGQDMITISSPAGELTAEIADNAAAKALLDMLPVTIEMQDHLRQEKTGQLPDALPQAQRQLNFENGTLGLWGLTDFVIYYRDGSVPRPGIVVLGRIQGDASILDHSGPITVEVKRVD